MILGVDVGGTFTDAVLLTATGVVVGKAPTTPEDQSAGVMAAIEQALDGADPRAVERLVHGMTVGTNALLEGRIARTALVATEGFTDLEELRRQTRAELYRPCVDHPPPLVPVELRVAAPERTGPTGVLRPLDASELRDRLRRLPADVEAVAVCLLWGFREPAHERAVADTVRSVLPDAHVSTSHETAGVFREYERLATTVVDAALSPLLRRYLERLTRRAADAGLPPPEVMLSSGGVADAAIAAAHASWTVLSGPAGGAVAAAHAALAAGSSHAAALDMGGTSCDVSLVTGGHVAVSGEREIGGHALALPMVDVHTVGAGGGSIAWRDDGGLLRVGPRSAGAIPGPAAYGRGGTEPTVSDANVVLGYLDGETSLAGSVRLNPAAGREAVGRLARTLGIEVEQAAAGIARVAEVEMAQAVRVVTVERGIDPRGLALVAFGGAGPLHAARIAEELGMDKVVAPATSGVLSALGLAISERRRDLQESVLLSGADLEAATIAETVSALARRGRTDLGEPDAEVRVSYQLRYAGQAFELPIGGGPVPDVDRLRRDFDRAHDERYGYADPAAELELVTIRVAVATPASEPVQATASVAERRGERRCLFEGDWHEAAVLGPGTATIEGPAIVELPGSTLVVPPGWSCNADADRVVITR